MDQLDIMVDGLRAEFLDRFITKDHLNSFEYKFNRQLGEAERAVA
jgi:hypothetical protein